MTEVREWGAGNTNIKVLYSVTITGLLAVVSAYIDRGWKLAGGICELPPSANRKENYRVTIVKEPATSIVLSKGCFQEVDTAALNALVEAIKEGRHED